MKTLKTLLIAAAMVASAPTFAGDAAAGKTAYDGKGCGGCHGPAGDKPTTGNPKLAGKSAADIKKALNDFKSGARKNATMTAMAGLLQPADIDNIAAYIGGQK